MSGADDQTPPVNGAATAEGDAQPTPPVFLAEGHIMASLEMSAQGHLPGDGYYIRGSGYIVLSRENTLSGWDAATPGLRPDDPENLALVKALVTVPCRRVAALSAWMLDKMHTYGLRMAERNGLVPRVSCEEKLVDLRPLSLALSHLIDENDKAASKKAIVTVEASVPGATFPTPAPFIRFTSERATAVIFCDRWTAAEGARIAAQASADSGSDAAAVSPEPPSFPSLFRIEGFVAVNPEPHLFPSDT